MDFMIIVIMLMTLYLAFGIGSNDETMSSVVGSGTLSLNRAVLWGGFCPPINYQVGGVGFHGNNNYRFWMALRAFSRVG